MHETSLLNQIRESERLSHTEMYSNYSLYQEGSWLSKPVKTVSDLFAHFEGGKNIRVLDLGCGVGRNSIAIAQHFQNVGCRIDCVDILELAIQKLIKNAAEFGVSGQINGIVEAIDDFIIPVDYYDWIVAVSALEHMDSDIAFIRKLEAIRDGLCKNGIVCLIINSNVKECLFSTKQEVPAQFEVNMQTEALISLLKEIYKDFHILKFTVKHQCYDIPRAYGVCELNSDVVTFAAVK